MAQQYNEYIKFNKNILLGFITSIIISVLAAHLLSGQAHYLNATLTLVIDYVVYFSTFGVLFYFDNRKKYVLNGEADKSAQKSSYQNYLFYCDREVVNLSVKLRRLCKNTT